MATTPTTSNVAVRFGANARRESVSANALRIIEDVLRSAGLTSCLITSTARTPADQARAMYQNLEAFGVKKQKDLYAAAGDAVIDAYQMAKSSKLSAKDVQSVMAAKIIAIGPEKVSRHCADPVKLCVVDIAPSSIFDKRKFEAAVKKDKRISRFLLPPLDPAYHLEIPEPAAAL